MAVMNNGAKKGGAPDAMQWIRKSPGLEDFWQLHYSLPGKDANVAEQYIANPEEKCPGHGIKVVASTNGSFTVTNARNQLTKEYKVRPGQR